MQAWLSPRIRLGVMASAIVLIVCAVLLTPTASDIDDLPDPAVAPTASIAPIAATPAAAQEPATLALPQFVVNALGSTSTGSLDAVLPGSELNDLSSATDPETWSSLEVAPDLLGESSLIDQSVLLALPDCIDCGQVSTPGADAIPFAGVPYRSSSGGAAAAYASAAGPSAGWIGGGPWHPDATRLSALTEVGNHSTAGIGEAEVHGSSPAGRLPSVSSKGDRERPSRKKPETVSVPEPSTLTLMTAAAFSVMVGAFRARRRRP